MVKARFFHSTLLLIVLGCATQPVATPSASPVPRERVLSADYDLPGPSTGVVVVKRDTGFMASGCSTRIFVNAKPVADLRPGEKVVLNLPEGDHILSAKPNGICGGGLVEARATVKAGSSIAFRISFSGMDNFEIRPTAF